MKTKYKYFILIIVTVLTSIFVYNYVEANTIVNMETDVLAHQKNIESNLIKDTNYTLDNPKIILNPYEISPLTALVVFKTNDLAAVTVTVKGKDNDKDIVNTFVPSKIHYISVYGLYPDYENTIIIETSGESKELKIKTEALPSNLKEANAINNNEDEFYFTTSNEDNGFPVAYDKNGNIRWYLTKPYTFDVTRLSNGYLLLGSNELMKSPYYSSSLLELDLFGKIYYEYQLPNGYHHDVYEMNDGNFLALSNDFNSGTIEDVIVEIDRDSGEIIKTINLYDLLPNDEGENWIALNSIAYDSNTNSILVTGDNQDLIINIDYRSGEINWLISKEDTKYSLKATNEVQFPTKPQALALTNNGFAFINSANGQNQLIEYKIDNNKRTFEEITNINLGQESEKANLEYDNNTFLITRDNTIEEVKDNKISKIMNTNSKIYSSKKTKMYAGDIYMLNEGNRLGSIGVTPVSKNHLVILHKVDNSIIDKYNISLTQTASRLIVKGTFNKKDKVQIILDNVLTKNSYDATISNELDNGKVYTETYINKEGIYGKHYIYLRINNEVYKLQKFITS